MLNWVKNTVGVTEPIYGPSAIQSVAEQAKQRPYTELKRGDLPWECMDSTCVESKIFYMLSDEGQLGQVQLLYSNVLGVRTTAQYSSKIYERKEGGQQHTWVSENLSHFKFSDDKQDFHSERCSMELSADGNSYAVKSSVDKRSVADLKFTKAAPGFVVGKDGTSYFGKDPQKPWGRMRHAFWPRCRVEGTITTPEGTVDFKGRAMFVHALQGMKPHFAAAKWNFCNFQSPSYSAILMSYTTPPSYGETVVTIGGIAKDDKLLFAGASPSVRIEHTEVKKDPENDWPEPSAVSFYWEGTSGDGDVASAGLSGPLGKRTDRVDVMGELPKFVKQIVAGTAGTKPYIYQFTPKMKLEIEEGGQTVEEEGQLFFEATFIT